MIGTCFALWMSGAAALADDAWGRPEHLRVVPVLTSQWSMRSRAQPLRVWWDGDQLGDVEVVYGSRWVRVGRGVASGFTTPPLPRDAQLRVRLAQAIDALPDQQRQAIILREIDGLAYKEIAEIMEIPEGTVMSRLYYARKKLQKTLEDER